MAFTEKALQDGFPLLVNPLVNIEHTGKQLDLSLLFTVPEIPHKNSFCTVEYLTPLKYNISGTCYTGPITYDNLALVTCSNVKSLVQVDSLQKCFQQDRTLLCPHHIFQSVKNVAWLGFPWNPTTKLSFPRHHQPARDCSDLHPLHVLGGRYYLATTADTLQLNTGPINTSPLAVYHFACNTTFNGMATGLGVCPDTMEVNIPLFNPDHIRYIPWKPTDDDSSWKLHYKSLNITQPLELDPETLNQLDNVYQHIDSRLSRQLNAVRDSITHIHNASTSTVNDICTYVALVFTALNTVALLLLIRKFCRHLPACLPRRRPQETLQDPQVQDSSDDPCEVCHLPMHQPDE